VKNRTVDLARVLADARALAGADVLADIAVVRVVLGDARLLEVNTPGLVDVALRALDHAANTADAAQEAITASAVASGVLANAIEARAAHSDVGSVIAAYRANTIEARAAEAEARAAEAKTRAAEAEARAAEAKTRAAEAAAEARVRVREALSRVIADHAHGDLKPSTFVVGSDSAVVKPVRAADRLVARAAQALPLGDQARYREEFDSELHDLAQDGASRRAQLAHALRISLRVWSLRRALRAPSPTGERVR
jgi:hypothetical protein